MGVYTNALAPKVLTNGNVKMLSPMAITRLVRNAINTMNPDGNVFPFSCPVQLLLCFWVFFLNVFSLCHFCKNCMVLSACAFFFFFFFGWVGGNKMTGLCARVINVRYLMLDNNLNDGFSKRIVLSTDSNLLCSINNLAF